ncbi:MAG TPA: alkane 1-monooxygenase, partial [Ferruginibacter sp.]|nr:alkane 1-monooxygenase [Ferruginibacter sp.]
MPVRALKYAAPLLLYVACFISFQQHGIDVWLPMIYAWVWIPLLELWLKPDEKNLSEAEETLAKQNPWYDAMLYAIVPLQYLALYQFLGSMQEAGLSSIDRIGRICSMGLLCGTFGINVGHELGHRIKPFEQWMAKALLGTSLYMHFFIEHNKGHHKNVATPQDPSSARYNEPVYLFYFRTILYSYRSAWHIANEECQKKKQSVFSLHNEMIQVHLLQALLVFLIGYVFGMSVLLYFLIAAAIGMLLLETVNYIEHYGLQRKPTASGYE